MSLEQILKYLQQAEQELVPLVEKEKQVTTERPVMYTFVYEQFFADTQEWGPNREHVEAYDLPGAFRTMGYVIEQMGLKIRNIRYGLYSEMLEEEDRISAYWKQEHEKRRIGDKL